MNDKKIVIDETSINKNSCQQNILFAIRLLMKIFSTKYVRKLTLK